MDSRKSFHLSNQIKYNATTIFPRLFRSDNKIKIDFLASTGMMLSQTVTILAKLIYSLYEEQANQSLLRVVVITPTNTMSNKIVR